MLEKKEEKKYINDTDNDVVFMSARDFYDYLYQEDVFYDKDRLPKLQKTEGIEDDGNMLLFFDYEKIDNTINTIRDNKYKPNTEEFSKALDESNMNNDMTVVTRDYLDVSFTYGNKEMHEKLELGDSIKVKYVEPETVDDRLLLAEVKHNAFFQGMDLKDMKLAVSEEGDKGVSIQGVFFDENTINYYIDKYPSEEKSRYIEPPKEDSKVLVVQPTREFAMWGDLLWLMIKIALKIY